MLDIDKLQRTIKVCAKFPRRDCEGCEYSDGFLCFHDELMHDFDKAIALLKEQEKKEIKLHKKHVLTLNRNDEFSMRKLYESVCEKLLDEGEMVITRTDNHENVEFVFYVAND